MKDSQHEQRLKNEPYLVNMIGVCIVTYNEETYIAECIDSALAQKCSEPIRVYVANDCSTDKTAEVCRSYGDKIVFIDREKNLGLVGNTFALLNQIRNDGCEYIAMLDGDDYWCDELKLQKQIDYMHTHPEYGLVHTCVDVLFPSGLKKDKRTRELEGNVFGKVSNITIGNCTVVFKTELLNLIDFEEFQQQGFHSVDYVMYYIFSSKTQFGFLPNHTAVWRRGHSSVSNNIHNEEQQIKYEAYYGIAVWKYLAQKFPDVCSYSDAAGSYYEHLCAFHISFRFGDRKRTKLEYHQMSEADQKRFRLKYWVILEIYENYKTFVEENI